MATHLVKMPKLSPTMEEGQIVRWLFAVKEQVPDQSALFEVATDKATVEHAILDGGWLRQILVPEGKSAKIGEVIALLTDRPEEVIDYVAKSVEEKPVVAAQVALQEEPKPSPGQRVIASPLAKKLALQQGIDLHQVQGSGPRGRVVSRDLEKSALAPLQPLTGMRAVIAKRLQEAKSTIPHFYLTTVVEVSDLVACYQQLKEVGVGITYNDFMIRAVALALKEMPELNLHYEAGKGQLRRLSEIDISIAVSVPGGIFTPILRKVDEKSLLTISQESKAMIKRAKEGKLHPSEYQGGSFTISNLGMFDLDGFTAIINPPQVAILAVAAISDAPVVKEGQVVAGKLLQLTLSVDHRVIDGKEAAQFLQIIKKLLSSPAILII